LSRIRIAAVFVAVLALAPALSACGGSSGPQKTVDEATLEGVESGRIDLALGIDVKGNEGGHVDVSLTGPFQQESGADTPELDLTAVAKGSAGGEKVDFQGGLTLLGKRAFVAYDGSEYKVDGVTYGFVRSMLRQQGGQGGSSEAAACQDAVGSLSVGDFVEGLSEEGGADVGGTETTKISGDLNAAGAVEALLELSEDPACNEQLDAAPGSLPSSAQLKKAKGEVQDSVKSAHVELYVGDDHIVRRIKAQVTIEPPAGSGSEGAEKVELDFDLTLTGVNEAQTISAPQNTKPLSALFIKLGVNPIELLSLIEGQGGLGSGGFNGLLEGIGGVGSVQ